MAEAMVMALDMPADEQRERLCLMRDQVRRRNVHRWAAQMLLDAARIRKRARIGVAAGDLGPICAPTDFRAIDLTEG